MKVDEQRVGDTSKLHTRWNSVYAFLARWGTVENILFLTLLTIHLVPVWAFKYFLTTDGPSHVYNAGVIFNYFRPEYSGLREYYELNNWLTTNFFGHLILVGLLFLVPAIVSEKILITAYILLLPLSIRYALSPINLNSRFLSILAFPFIYTHFLHQGFYNFVLSIPMTFFAIGYWLRYRHQFKAIDVVILTSLTLLVLFCHIISLIPLSVTLVILAISFGRSAMVRSTTEDKWGFHITWQTLRTPSLLSLLCLLPAWALAAVFIFRQGPRVSYGEYSWRIFLWPFYGIFALTNSTENLFLSTTVVGLFVGILSYAIVARNRDRYWTPWDAFLLASLTIGVICLIVPPEVSGGNATNFRLIVFALLVLILWFGAQNFLIRLRIALQVVTTSLSVLLIIINIPVYSMLNEDVSEYLSGASVIKPHSTVLSLCFAPEGCGLGISSGYLRTSPMSHLGEYISAERHSVSLSNYEAEKGYFPVLYRSQLNPTKYLGVSSISGQRSWAGLARYSAETRGRIDYLTIWSPSVALGDNQETEQLFKWLIEDFELVFTSFEHGRLQIYRNKHFGL